MWRLRFRVGGGLCDHSRDALLFTSGRTGLHQISLRTDELRRLGIGLSGIGRLGLSGLGFRVLSGIP